jgi:hypothetical protein
MEKINLFAIKKIIVTSKKNYFTLEVYSEGEKEVIIKDKEVKKIKDWYSTYKKRICYSNPVQIKYVDESNLTIEEIVKNININKEDLSISTHQDFYSFCVKTKNPYECCGDALSVLTEQPILGLCYLELKSKNLLNN